MLNILHDMRYWNGIELYGDTTNKRGKTNRIFFQILCSVECIPFRQPTDLEKEWEKQKEDRVK